MTAALQNALAELIASESLSAAQIEAAFEAMMSDRADPAAVAGFLAGLAVRGEQASDLAAGARVLRRRARPFTAEAAHAVDICGTGGTGLDLLNISTASALVAAAAGTPITKHGNRAVTSKSGASDVLQALGARLDIPAEAVIQSFSALGFCFLYAPLWHPAMRHVAPVRAALKVRTIFNLLGPLANPAGVRRQLLGVRDTTLLPLFAEVLQALGVDHAWIVHGAAGEDEISLAGPSDIIALEAGKLRRFTVTPEDAGLSARPLAELQGGTAAENANAIRALFAGAGGAYHDAVCLNAGAACYLGGQAESWRAGVTAAAEALASGAAATLLARWISTTERAAEAACG